MRDNNSYNKKNYLKNVVISVLLLTFLIATSSFLLESCDGSFLDDEDFNQMLDYLNKDQEGDREYFSYDILDGLVNDSLSWTIENEEVYDIPTSINILEFTEERMFGWANLGGFITGVKNGFYYFEVEDNIITIMSDDETFIATIDFDKCWKVNDKTYCEILINNFPYKCFF
ncbi:MAG: hypothetical protein ACPKNR_02445 [Pleomorphochaeta sp.]